MSDQQADERLTDPNHGDLLPVYVGETPMLLDRDTAKAVRVLCWTATYLLWLWAAVSFAVVVMFAVAAINGGLPG